MRLYEFVVKCEDGRVRRFYAPWHEWRVEKARWERKYGRMRLLRSRSATCKCGEPLYGYVCPRCGRRVR